LAALAKVMVRYSLRVKKGEWVAIVGPPLAQDFIRAAYREVLSAGGNPTVNMRLPGIRHILLKHAGEDQLRFVAPSEKTIFEKADKMLLVLADWNTKELTRIDPKRLSIVSQANNVLFQTLLKREAAGEAAWVLTLIPTESAAQDAEMALSEYEEFVYGAGMLGARDPLAEWRKVSARQARMVKFLNTLKTVRIVGKDTDITFGVAGRKWINCDGHVNFPDGEIFTSPLEGATEGHILYTFPAVYGGREVENVRLTFEKGKAVKAEASKGEDLRTAMLKTDAGATRVGELAFGTNYSIKNFTKNTLFDEKIGGTMHVAVGQSLPKTGGSNKSAIHWDMVCDTRKGFTIYGNGKPIQRNGKFLVP
jgi:aminopeptidase